MVWLCLESPQGLAGSGGQTGLFTWTPKWGRLAGLGLAVGGAHLCLHVALQTAGFNIPAARLSRALDCDMGSGFPKTEHSKMKEMEDAQGPVSERYTMNSAVVHETSHHRAYSDSSVAARTPSLQGRSGKESFWPPLILSHIEKMILNMQGPLKGFNVGTSVNISLSPRHKQALSKTLLPSLFTPHPCLSLSMPRYPTSSRAKGLDAPDFPSQLAKLWGQLTI